MRRDAWAAAFLLVALGTDVACGLLNNRREEILISNSTRIQKGMRADEVIEIMGKPSFIGVIDSSKLPIGWDLAWRTSFEELRKKYDKLLFYNYHMITYSFPFFRKKPGGLHINVCFDIGEQRVVYVSRFHAMESSN